MTLCIFQELSNTECKLTATQSKLAVAEHKIQGLEQSLQKQKSRPSDSRYLHLSIIY